jgi:hypothetical protein
MGARQLDLLRRWTVRPDPDNSGVDARWWENPPREGWVSCRTDEPWQKTLGHAYHGVAWYRRRARLPLKWLGQGQRVWLRFGAVATDCRVWVNGVEVGSHAGDYVPFEFDITDALGEDEHCEVVCRVDEIKGSPPKVWGQEPWGGHITKGFHDVLSLQKGGIWGGVSARATGPVSFRPNGLSAAADPTTGEVRVRLEFEPHGAGGVAEIVLVEPGTGEQQRGRVTIEPGASTAEAVFVCPTVHLWSPDEPTLGDIHATVRTKGVPARDEATCRFAFRTFEVGGRDNRRILMNGRPLLLRGMLDWGVEHEHIAPTPTRDELLERFTELRARGFNCVCLCMVYPHEEFFEVADETGMLLWQIHPIWKSDMAAPHMPEYKRLFDEFFRRDRRHPSVFLVSATCEHECFDAELGRWWWGRGREELPHNLLQVQTGFLRWSDTERMDLWDEHTYDNTGRWLCYLDDLEAFFEANPARPFVMGETIIGTSWPDTAGLLERLGDERPWWAPKGLDGFAEFERSLVERFGADALARLRTHGDAFNLGQRKTQCEALRSRAHNAGWVMNHLRDVFSCQCGFEDDLGRWRFGPEQLGRFLDERILLLRTTNGAVGLGAGEPTGAEVGLSNFGAGPFEGFVRLRTWVETGAAEIELPVTEVSLRVEPGEVGFATAEINPAAGEDPVMIRCRAEGAGLTANEWRLWAFPKCGETPGGVFRDDASAFTPEERSPDFEEKRYSSGWALECSSWKPRLPDLDLLLPRTRHWRDAEPAPRVDHLTIVTTRLTEHMLLHLEHGGRVVLLASKAAGSPPTKWVNLYGQIPMLIERSERTPNALLAPGESAWVLDSLGLDLNRWSCRAAPTQELGIAGAVEPVVRLVFTHDKGRPEVWDQVFTARVGAGLLAVSTLDHDSPAGRYLLRRLIGHVHRGEAPALERGVLDIETVRSWSCPA